MHLRRGLDLHRRQKSKYPWYCTLKSVQKKYHSETVSYTRVGGHFAGVYSHTNTA